MTIGEYIEPELDQIREVYARFGLAMYQAHCLERQLAIILATREAWSNRRLGYGIRQRTRKIVLKDYGALGERHN